MNLRSGELTPLMVAARAGYANIVKNLLKAGADPSLTDNNGKRAIDLATGKRADKVRAALSS